MLCIWGRNSKVLYHHLLFLLPPSHLKSQNIRTYHSQTTVSLVGGSEASVTEILGPKGATKGNAAKRAARTSGEAKEVLPVVSELNMSSSDCAAPLSAAATGSKSVFCCINKGEVYVCILRFYARQMCRS